MLMIGANASHAVVTIGDRKLVVTIVDSYGDCNVTSDPPTVVQMFRATVEFTRDPTAL